MEVSTEVNRVLLKKVGFYIEEVMPGHYFRDVEVETYIEPMARSMVFRLRAYLYGQEDVVTSNEVDKWVSIPTSWWQMLKKEHFPEWLLKRFPVNEYSLAVSRQVTRNITKVCPHTNVQSQYDHIQFFMRKI